MHLERNTVRSFVRRERHQSLSPMLKRLWEQYSINLSHPNFLTHYFNNTKKAIILEIGFGKGESLLTQARTYSDKNYLGIEVYRKGIFSMLSALSHHSLDNLRFIEGDACEILSKYFSKKILDQIQILFPDPWPKKRHHKRRLIQTDFIEQLYHLLKPGGSLYLATDWPPYALHILKVIDEVKGFIKIENSDEKSSTWLDIPTTKFEKRAFALHHKIKYLHFIKC